MVGSRPDVLTYPVGGPGAITDITKRLAREVGYRAAFSYHGGSIVPRRRTRSPSGGWLSNMPRRGAESKLATTLSALGLES